MAKPQIRLSVSSFLFASGGERYDTIKSVYVFTDSSAFLAIKKQIEFYFYLPVFLLFSCHASSTLPAKGKRSFYIYDSDS